MWEFRRKFDINSLYVCPPYLYTVTTLPWKIQNSHFSTVLFIQTSYYYELKRNKPQLLYCSLSVYLLLFTASYYLLSPILWSVFFKYYFWSVIFKATNAKPQLALFRVTNIWRNATLPAVRCKSFTFYKVVWWYFLGVVSKGVAVCFFSEIT